MAPELLEDQTFTEKSDVYSYAIVLWEIYDRGIPWSGLMPAQIISKVIVKHARPPVPKGMPANLRTLMCRCWAHKPDKRPTFAEVVKEVAVPTPRRPSSSSFAATAAPGLARDETPSGQGPTRSLGSGVLDRLRGVFTPSREAAADAPPPPPPPPPGATVSAGESVDVMELSIDGVDC